MNQKADIILKSNIIFDGFHKMPEGGFVAVKQNKILALGKSDIDLEGFIGPKTKVYRFKNKILMPSFHDSHTHLILAGMYKTYVNLGAAKSEDEAAQMVKRFADTIPNEGWIIGFNWYHIFWDNKVLPTKQSLDKYISDRPVFLLNAEAHGAWANSKALEIAGVTRNTEDPYGGEVSRFENGEPSGFLYETALGLVGVHALKFTPAQDMIFVKKYMESAAALGITAVNDMQPYFGLNMGSYEAYKGLEDAGELNIRIHCAPDLLGDLDEAVKWRDKYNTEKIKVSLLKQFLDGVPTTYTGLMLEDYSDKSGDKGTSLSDLDFIAKQVEEGHKRGFSIRLHSCGDRSLRLGLDFYENAIKKYGKNATRHGIEHCEVIHEDDVIRFKELGIIPSMQPEHIAITNGFLDNPYPDRLGEARSKRTWMLKTLLDSAGILAIGSDCPVVDNNPFLALYRGFTRLHNDGTPLGGWNPKESLTLEELLHCYTYGSAYGVSREHELGSIKKGNFADLTILDKNIFAIDPIEILNGTKVEMTVMDGKIIYGE